MRTILMKKLLALLSVLMFAAGLGGKANAEDQPHHQYRTPRGAIHCYITTLDGDNDFKPNSWTGYVACSTRTLMSKGRHAEIWVTEQDRSDLYSVGGFGVVNMHGGTTLRAGRTYVFRYPWRTGRKMFWVTVRRTPTVESLHVRNPEGHGFLIKVGVASGRTTLVRF
jgi:hypothetical protein